MASKHFLRFQKIATSAAKSARQSSSRPPYAIYSSSSYRWHPRLRFHISPCTSRTSTRAPWKIYLYVHFNHFIKKKTCTKRKTTFWTVFNILCSFLVSICRQQSWIWNKMFLQQICVNRFHPEEIVSESDTLEDCGVVGDCIIYYDFVAVSGPLLQ